MIKFKLKVLLAENEMTAAELSEKIGVRQATLSAMNKGTIKQVPLHVIDGNTFQQKKSSLSIKRKNFRKFSEMVILGNCDQDFPNSCVKAKIGSLPSTASRF